MKAYSIDLRERVVASVESGECNIPEAARRYKVSEPSIERWLARKRTTGDCAPLPHAGGLPRKLASAEAIIFPESSIAQNDYNCGAMKGKQ